MQNNNCIINSSSLAKMNVIIFQEDEKRERKKYEAGNLMNKKKIPFVSNGKKKLFKRKAMPNI